MTLEHTAYSRTTSILGRTGQYLAENTCCSAYSEGTEGKCNQLGFSFTLTGWKHRPLSVFICQHRLPVHASSFREISPLHQFTIKERDGVAQGNLQTPPLRFLLLQAWKVTLAVSSSKALGVAFKYAVSHGLSHSFHPPHPNPRGYSNHQCNIRSFQILHIRSYRDFPPKNPTTIERWLF